jgi:hypothetical protein
MGEASYLPSTNGGRNRLTRLARLAPRLSLAIRHQRGTVFFAPPAGRRAGHCLPQRVRRRPR